MRNTLVVIVLLIAATTGMLKAQVPLTGPSLNVDLGLGGGLSMPTGSSADAWKQGYHLGAKGRLSGSIPISITGFATYNSLTEKNADTTDTQWLVGAGLEYAIPSAMVHPYFAIDGMGVFFSKKGSGGSSYNRIGIGGGVGVLFGVPAFGSFDLSAKYQLLNLVGKESNESDLTQVALNLSVMFSLH